MYELLWFQYVWMGAKQWLGALWMTCTYLVNPFTAEFLTNFTVLQKNHYIKSATAYNS